MLRLPLSSWLVGFGQLATAQARAPLLAWGSMQQVLQLATQSHSEGACQRMRRHCIGIGLLSHRKNYYGVCIHGLAWRVVDTHGLRGWPTAPEGCHPGVPIKPPGGGWSNTPTRTP